jgi:serine O-acetyltransferase
MNSSVAAEHWRKLRMDAARWIRPQEVGDAESLRPSSITRLMARYPPLRAMAWFRFGSMLRDLGVRGVPSWVQRRLLRLYGLELRVGADVGGGLYIAHPVGCVLAASSIGTNVTVISQVTFGTRDDGEWPKIGDQTFFGVGSRVLGGVHIGDGARVGANAVVLSDVGPGQTVVGIPARVIAPRIEPTPLDAHGGSDLHV